MATTFISMKQKLRFLKKDKNVSGKERFQIGTAYK